MDGVRDRYIKFGARNVARCGEIDFPENLFDKPLLGGFFKDLRGFRNFFYGSDAFPVALGGIVDIGELGVPIS